MTAFASQSGFFFEVIDAALKAGEAILDVYQSDFAVKMKDDRSPLTLADHYAHEIISSLLVKTGFPILSEEGKDIPYEARKNWEYFWLVDPLDGTKEFIRRNGEFTVNIALIQKNSPVMGLVYVPVKDVIYFGAKGLGAYKLDNAYETIGVRLAERKEMDAVSKSAVRLPLAKDPGRPYTVVTSRSHMSKETAEYLDKLRTDHGDIELVSAGSSLKFCLIAEGRADVYPRLGRTMEWDTAAGQIIVEESGGMVLSLPTSDPLIYNKESLANPFFIAKGPGVSAP